MIRDLSSLLCLPDADLIQGCRVRAPLHAGRISLLFMRRHGMACGIGDGGVEEDGRWGGEGMEGLVGFERKKVSMVAGPERLGKYKSRKKVVAI